ncbi:MAG: glucuronate isomerase, partial [Bacteroidota bacterium]
MPDFIHEDFLLESAAAKKLYHDYAAKMPIIDYHNHLSPAIIANNYNFSNITEAWIDGDHYKWRAMRANGLEEKYCSGSASAFEKFSAWASTVPKAIRNPLHHWSQLELMRYFGVSTLLDSHSAATIYDRANEILSKDSHTPQGLIKMMGVEFVGTTDDPTDSLEHHKYIIDHPIGIQVAPTFRPDKAMAIDGAVQFNLYVSKLEQRTNTAIQSFNDYIEALKFCHDYFETMGCKASDHGIEVAYYEPYTHTELEKIFDKVRLGAIPSELEVAQFKTAMLIQFAEWGYEKGWVQQYHIGPIRNNSTRMFNAMGPDTGWDSIGSSVHPKKLSLFLNHLDKSNKLAKTVLYSINAADNDMLATMAGNFNDGSYPGKIQSGAAWWFNDQKDGITAHLNAVSNMGLLSRFIGMLTDSRSFLSFPRHEYFRRILCNVLGSEMERGLIPFDYDLIGGMTEDICYN